MSILKKHVVDAMCEHSATAKPRFGEFLTNLLVGGPRLIRMAVKPRNSTKAGFFYSCRTPHVSTEPEWAARNKTPATLHPRVEPTELRSGIGEVVLSSGETSGTMKVNGRLMAQLVSPGTMRRYGQGYHPLGKGIV